MRHGGVDAAVSWLVDPANDGAARRIGERSTEYVRHAPSLNYSAMARRTHAYLLSVWQG